MKGKIEIFFFIEQLISHFFGNKKKEPLITSNLCQSHYSRYPCRYDISQYIIRVFVKT